MYPISNAVMELFENEQTKVLRITGTDRNGASINITDNNVVENSFEIDRYSCNGQKLEVGTAVAAQMSLKLFNGNGQYDNIIFEGAELNVEIGIADWSESSPTITYVPCGLFTPDIQPRRMATISLTCFDRMTKFDVALNATALTLPTTIAGLVAQVCTQRGVTLAQSISSLPNASVSVSALPEVNGIITYRNLIQWCAGIMGTNAWIDWNGELRFSWYNNTTGYISTIDNRYSSDLYENALVITGVKFKDTDDAQTVYQAGADTYSLDLTGNFLINSDNAATILQNIYNVVHNFAYTPFSATVIAAPYLWPMDRMVFTDKDNNGHVSLLTNVNFGLNGNTALSAVGETIQTASAANPSSFTQLQKQELEHIQRVNSTRLLEAVDHATEMITGGLGGYVVLSVNETTGRTEEILIMDSPNKNTAVNVWRFNQGGLAHSSNGYNGPFNDVALTADGKINASMILVGTMVADRIMGGTLTLGGANNVNGQLVVKDANGAMIGTWGKDGINILEGLIAGPSIDLKYYPTTGESTTLTLTRQSDNYIYGRLYVYQWPNSDDAEPHLELYDYDLDEPYDPDYDIYVPYANSSLSPRRLRLAGSSSNSGYVSDEVCNISISAVEISSKNAASPDDCFKIGYNGEAEFKTIHVNGALSVGSLTFLVGNSTVAIISKLQSLSSDNGQAMFYADNAGGSSTLTGGKVTSTYKGFVTRVNATTFDLFGVVGSGATMVTGRITVSSTSITAGNFTQFSGTSI